MTKLVWVVAGLVVGLAALLFLTANPCWQCRSEFWDEVLGEAEQRQFDYCGAFHAAMRGDEAAIARLLEFSNCTDAGSALGHGCAIIKVLQAVGDDRFAACIRRQSAELRERIGGTIEAGIDCGLGEHPDDMPKLFPSSQKAVTQGKP